MDESVFHRIYEEYHQDVYRFLIYLTKDRTLSEDLLHEVYVRVLNSFGSFQGKSSERTWLFSIARNVAFDHFRRVAVRRKRTDESFDWATVQPADRRPTPEEAAVHEDEMGRLFKVLDDCTEDQRLVLVMRFLQELSIAETAEVLGWTEAKVKTTQHRAVKKARELLGKLGGREVADDEQRQIK